MTRGAHRTRTSRAGRFRTTVAVPVPFQGCLNHLNGRWTDGLGPSKTVKSTSVTAVKTVGRETDSSLLSSPGCRRAVAAVHFRKNPTRHQHLPFQPQKIVFANLAVCLSTSSRPTSAAATFTHNAFQVAPVTVSVLERPLPTQGEATGSLDHCPLDPYRIEDIWDAVLYTLRPQASGSSPARLPYRSRATFCRLRFYLQMRPHRSGHRHKRHPHFR